MENQNKKSTNKKAQIFSTDIIVVIVIVLFGAIFLVMNQISSQTGGNTIEEKHKIAQTQSKLIINNLKTNDILESDSTINVEKLVLIDKDELIAQLNLKNKFCIVFEKDGKLVRIDPSSETNGIGSSEIVVNDLPCK